MHVYCFPLVPHVTPISFFLVWLPAKYLLMSTDRKAHLYAGLLYSPVASSRLGSISSSAPYSQKPSAHVPSSMCETKFHTHTKQQAKLEFCIFQSLQFWIENWKTKGSASHDRMIENIPWFQFALNFLYKLCCWQFTKFPKTTSSKCQFISCVPAECNRC